MKTTALLFAIFIAIVGIEAAIDQIWLSPTDVTALMNAGSVEMPDYADAPKFEWTNITTGISSRYEKPLVQIDSKGLIWVVSGYSNAFWMNSVWSYDPKTDLYRWVAGDPATTHSDYIKYGDFGIPSPDAFPSGTLCHSASTIDRDDNIWFYGSCYNPTADFWRFNTTSFEFTYFSLSDPTTVQMVTDIGIPSPLNYPGYTYGAILATDSQNNLWLVGGLDNSGYPRSAIWHFNTTSIQWTWMHGTYNTTEIIDYNNNVVNGRWNAGGFIDSEDRIWMYGGYGYDLSATSDWSDLWSFDTKTLQWRVEWAPEKSFKNPNTVVSSDYDPGNIPAARDSSQLVDRLDGTLMIVGGYREFESTKLNDIWLFNKTSKMWKMVYGEIDGGNYPSNYTNYRQVGGMLGSRKYYGSPSGPNNRGHYIIYGGVDSVTPLNDIWVIPQDPCVLCDVNADCNPVDIWSNACTCKQGYSGDGKTCTLDVVPVADAPLATPVASPSSDTPVITPVSTNTPQSKSGTSSGSAFFANFSLVAVILTLILSY